MRNKSVLQEAQDIQKAVDLIRLGARMQMLEAETSLSRERLLKLYKEVRGVSPPKGMLPFSTDWFMSWQPNIHASLFMAFYRFVRLHAKQEDLDAMRKELEMWREEKAKRAAELESEGSTSDDVLKPLRAKHLDFAGRSRRHSDFLPPDGIVVGS